jgi:uncharacterized protein (TIGR02145 family)
MGFAKWLMIHGFGSPGKTAKEYTKRYNKMLKIDHDDEWEEIFLSLYNIRVYGATLMGNIGGNIYSLMDKHEVVNFSQGDLPLFFFEMMYLETSRFRRNITMYRDTFMLATEVIREIIIDNAPTSVKLKLNDFREEALNFITCDSFNSLQNNVLKNVPNEQTGTVTDIDGNVYHTVTIGTQVWMVENLKVTHYRNGEPIPNVIEKADWSDLSKGAYCFYDNEPNNSKIYGNIFNWYAVHDIRQIAPKGWHIPTGVEWNTLITYLGDNSIAGNKLKEAGTEHWLTPNTGTNESGFTALPGGFRSESGKFADMGSYGLWWRYNAMHTDRAFTRRLSYGHSYVDSDTYMCQTYGFSVRCLRD